MPPRTSRACGATWSVEVARASAEEARNKGLCRPRTRIEEPEQQRYRDVRESERLKHIQREGRARLVEQHRTDRRRDRSNYKCWLGEAADPNGVMLRPKCRERQAPTCDRGDPMPAPYETRAAATNESPETSSPMPLATSTTDISRCGSGGSAFQTSSRIGVRRPARGRSRRERNGGRQFEAASLQHREQVDGEHGRDSPPHAERGRHQTIEQPLSRGRDTGRQIARRVLCWSAWPCMRLVSRQNRAVQGKNEPEVQGGVGEACSPPAQLF